MDIARAIEAAALTYIEEREKVGTVDADAVYEALRYDGERLCFSAGTDHDGENADHRKAHVLAEETFRTWIAAEKEQR